jgi:serine/threonine-protein kinase RsbT
MSSIAAKKSCRRKVNIVRASLQATPHRNVGKDQIYGGGGDVHLYTLRRNGRVGLRLEFIDNGPGIADIPRALADGYTSGNGLGLGLGGAKRLCDEFEIRSVVGEGTHVSVTKWKPF